MRLLPSGQRAHAVTANDVSSGKVVLSDVALHPSPRALLRPPRSSRPDVTKTAGPLVKADALDEGYAQGAREGQARGYQDGWHQGKSEGYTEGYERGQAEGRASAARDVALQAQTAQEEIDARLRRLDSLAASLSAQFAEQLGHRLRDAEADMVAVAHAAACRLLGEHSLRSDNVVLAVRRAVEQHLSNGAEPAARLVSIHVHPDDLELLRGQTDLNTWLTELQGSRDVRWQADVEVGTGGCIVRGSMDSLDARLDTQLDALHREFAQHRAHQSARVEPNDASATGQVLRGARDEPDASA